jgi:hypothetical protein
LTIIEISSGDLTFVLFSHRRSIFRLNDLLSFGLRRRSALWPIVHFMLLRGLLQLQLLIIVRDVAVGNILFNYFEWSNRCH